MESKRYIDKNFYIVRYKMNAGDVKEINFEEIIRNGKNQDLSDSLRMGLSNMTDQELVTARSITVIVSGRIKYIKPTEEVYFEAGDGAWPWTIPPKENEIRYFIAMEDGTEYHCIQPRDLHARWVGKIHKMVPNNVIEIEESTMLRQVLYVCAGSINVTNAEGKTVEVQSPTMVELTPGQRASISTNTSAMVTEMWIEGD